MTALYIPRQLEIREIQRAIQSVQRSIAQLGDTGVTDALSDRISQILSQLNTLNNRLNALAARVAALESEELVFTAGESLSLGDPVVQSEEGIVTKATDNTDLNMQAFVGLAKNDAATGAEVRVAQTEPLTNENWDWYPGVVYLDTDGTLTQDEPMTGSIMIVGVVVDPTTVYVDSRVLGITDYLDIGTAGVSMVSRLFQTTLEFKTLAEGFGIALDDDSETIHIEKKPWTFIDAQDSGPYILSASDTQQPTWILVDNIDTSQVFVPLDAGVRQGVPIRITAKGSGAVEIDPDTGVTVFSPSGLSISPQYATVELTCIGENTYLVSQ